METIIESNPKATLKEIQDKLHVTFNLQISTETIRKKLDGMCYSLKKCHNEPENANSEINKLKRKQYAMSFMNHQSTRCPILFMDDTNFNLFISRANGRSITGRLYIYKIFEKF